MYCWVSAETDMKVIFVFSVDPAGLVSYKWRFSGDSHSLVFTDCFALSCLFHLFQVLLVMCQCRVNKQISPYKELDGKLLFKGIHHLYHREFIYYVQSNTCPIAPEHHFRFYINISFILKPPIHLFSISALI